MVGVGITPEGINFISISNVRDFCHSVHYVSLLKVSIKTMLCMNLRWIELGIKIQSTFQNGLTHMRSIDMDSIIFISKVHGKHFGTQSMNTLAIRIMANTSYADGRRLI